MAKSTTIAHEIITTTEAADELGVSLSLVHRLLNRGLFAGARRMGRDWAIPRSSLDAVKARPTKRGRPRRAPDGAA